MEKIKQIASNGQIIVCIDDYENEVPSGCFYHVNLEQGTRFCGVVQFLKRLDNMMEWLRYPQGFMSLRTFQAQEQEAMESLFSEMYPCQGKRATFAIHVLFRQNASWQGDIIWLEGGRKESFRSVLEMLFLMDNALKVYCKVKPSEQEERSSSVQRGNIIL